MNDWKDHEEGFIRAMLDASIHAVLLLEPNKHDGEITDFLIKASNPALSAHAGLSPIDVVTKPMGFVFPQYKNFGFFDLYRNALISHVPQRKQLYYKDERLEGWFDVGVAPYQDKVLVHFANITDHHRFQKELEQTTVHLNTIINTAQSGIFLFAPIVNAGGEVVDFTFTNANPAFAAYVGQDPHTIIGDPGSKWFPAYKENGLFDRYKHTYLSGHTNRFEFHYNADGIDVWLDILSTRLGDEVLVTFTDHTAIKKLQLQLEETIAELQRSNANLQDFAYIASHDLQEPLRKINFFTDRLNTNYNDKLGSEGAMILQRIAAATDRMGTLINDLLEFSQLSSSQFTMEDVPLKAVVQEVLADLEATVQQQKARLTIGELPTVKADVLMMRQLFQNLISNSLKYHAAGVEPHIEISHETVTGSQSGIDMKGGDGNRMYHKISVSDNGIGFDQEHAQRIFQIFQRLHGRSEYPGTGVGLAIVQKVVERHDGYIAANGKPGEGAVFSVLLPVN